MSTPVIIMVLILMAIVGTVMTLKPSARDSRLATLRLDAIRAGLTVRQFIFKPESEKNGVRDDISATSYTLLAPVKPGGHQQSKNDALRYRIVAQQGWDTDGLPEGFCWHDKGDEQQAQLFSQQIELLDDQLLMLEVYEQRITMMTAEQQGAKAENYLQFMQRLREAG